MSTQGHTQGQQGMSTQFVFFFIVFLRALYKATHKATHKASRGGAHSCTQLEE